MTAFVHLRERERVSPVGTDDRPPAHMGWSENGERERVVVVWYYRSNLRGSHMPTNGGDN